MTDVGYRLVDASTGASIGNVTITAPPGGWHTTLIRELTADPENGLDYRLPPPDPGFPSNRGRRYRGRHRG